MRQHVLCAFVVLLLQAAFSDAQGQTRWSRSDTPPRRVRGATPKVVQPPRLVIPAAVCDAAADLRSRRGPDCHVRFLEGASRSTLIHGLGTRDGAPSSLEISIPDARAKQAALVATALDLIRSEDAVLAVPDPDTSLVVDKVHTLRGLNVVRFYQQHEGLRILGSEVIAQYDSNDTLRSVLVNTRQELRVSTESRVSREQAIDAAAKRVREGLPPRAGLPSKAELCILPGASGARLVWDVWVLVEAGPFRVIVDAMDARVINFSNMLLRVDCTPKPVADVYTVSPVEGPTELVELDDLDCGETLLRGEFIHSFNWTGEDLFFGEPAFEFSVQGEPTTEGVVFSASDDASLAQTTTYFHGTELHGFFGELGFTSLDRPLPALTNVDRCFGSCANAFYIPFFSFDTGLGAIAFGRDAAVNLGLDPDVVAHEYTHAVVQETAGLGDVFFDPDLFYTRAINEAYADFFAATYTDDPLVGEYFSRARGLGDFLRKVDNSLVWPNDINAFSYHLTGQIWSGALWRIRQEFSSGGTDPDGVERAHALAFATLASLPSNADMLDAATILMTTAEAMNLSDEDQQTVRLVLVDRGLIQGDGEPPTMIVQLFAGDAANGDIAGAEGGAPRLSSVQYEVAAYYDVSRLVFRLQGAGDLDLYVRYNTPVSLDGDAVVADFQAEDPGTRVIDVSDVSTPTIRSGSYFVAVVNRGASDASYTLSTELEFAPFEQFIELAPGQPALGIAFEELDFFQFTFEVPETLGKQLSVTLDADDPVDLFVRYGAPVVIGAEGEIVADVALRFPERAKTLGLDALTIPELQPGTYYMATGVGEFSLSFYLLVPDLLDVPANPPTEELLPSEMPRNGSVAAASRGVGRRGAAEYVVDVPPGTVALRVRLDSPVDMALHVRAAEPVATEDGILVADYSSNLAGRGDETIEIDFFSSPILREGTYHITLVNHSLQPADYTIEAVAEAFVPGGVVGDLPEGTFEPLTAEGSIDGGPRLATTQLRFVLTEPSPGIDLMLLPLQPGNVDLYMRREFPVQLVEGAVLADWRSETSRGEEAITLPMEEGIPGSYFVAFVNRESVDIDGEVFAGYRSDPPLTIRSEDGDAWLGTLNGCEDCCVVEISTFAIDVPPGAVQLDVAAKTPEGDFLDVLPRFGSRPLLALGQAIFDEELFTPGATIRIRDDQLQTGTYYFVPRHCGELDQPYEIRFRILMPVVEEQTLRNETGRDGTAAGVPEGFEGRLHRTQYIMEVPPEQGEAVFFVRGGDCAELDVDLYVRREEQLVWDAATGVINASWSGETRGAGAETVVVPNPLPGRYFCAVVNREREEVPILVFGAYWIGHSFVLPAAEDRIPTAIGDPDIGLFQDGQFRVFVPPGSTEFTASLSPLVDGGDLDLYSRYGLPVLLLERGFVSEATSSNPTSLDSIRFPAPDECLRPGYYFVGFTNFGGADETFAFRADVGRGPCQALQIGDRVEGVQQSVGAGVLAIPDTQYCLSLGEADPGVQVVLIPTAFGDGRNLDLYLRRDDPVAFGPNDVTAEHRSEAPGVVESIILEGERPSAATYFVAVTSRGSVATDFALVVRALEETTREVTLGVEESGVAPESLADGVLWLAPEQFRLEVPPGVEGVRIELETALPTSSPRLHVRRDRRVEVVGQSVVSNVFDGRPDPLKTVELVRPSGVYYIAIENLGTRPVPFLLRVDSTAKLVRRGDVDDDGVIDIGDPMRAIFRLFVSPIEICVAAGDADGVGGFGITDAIYLLNFLFLGGPPPVAPFPQCSAVAADTEECTSAGCF